MISTSHQVLLREKHLVRWRRGEGARHTSRGTGRLNTCLPGEWGDRRPTHVRLDRIRRNRAREPKQAVRQTLAHSFGRQLTVEGVNHCASPCDLWVAVRVVFRQACECRACSSAVLTAVSNRSTPPPLLVELPRYFLTSITSVNIFVNCLWLWITNY